MGSKPPKHVAAPSKVLAKSDLGTVREGDGSARNPPGDTLTDISISHTLEGIPGMAVQVYPSDLVDVEWALLTELLPTAKPGGRSRSVDLRLILNGLLYLVRSGCAWRYLPRDYGPWSTVYHYFRL